MPKSQRFFFPLSARVRICKPVRLPRPSIICCRSATLILSKGAMNAPPCCPGCTIGLGPLRVVSQQAAIHESIHRTPSRIRNSFDLADELAQKDYLRLPCGLFLLSLESD